MSTGERFWELLCDHRPHLSFLFSLLIALGVITIIAVWMAEPGSAGHVIAVVNLGLVGVSLVPVGYCLLRCLRLERYDGGA